MAISHVLANVINFVDVRHVIVDGELAGLIPWASQLTRQVNKRTLAGADAPPVFRLGMAGEYGPALGGALLALTGY